MPCRRPCARASVHAVHLLRWLCRERPDYAANRREGVGCEPNPCSATDVIPCIGTMYMCTPSRCATTALRNDRPLVKALFLND